MNTNSLDKRRHEGDERADDELPDRPERWGPPPVTRAEQPGQPEHPEHPEEPLTPERPCTQPALSAANNAESVVPPEALLPLLDHIPRSEYLASLVPGSALAATQAYFPDRVRLHGSRLVGSGGPAPHLTLANVHKFAARLDVPPHRASECAGMPADKGKGAAGPNAISVLRIDLGRQESGTVALHIDSRQQRCPLLEAPGVRPHTLVLRRVPCLYGRVPAGLLPLDALDAVRAVTFVLDHRLACADESGFAPGIEGEPLAAAFARGHDPRPAGAAALLATIPARCEHVTIVFYPGSGGGVWDPPAPVGDGLCDSWAGTLFAQLAHGLAGLPQRPRVALINAGAIDPAAVLPAAERATCAAEMREGGYITYALVQSALETWFERNWRAAAPGAPPVTWVSMHEWLNGSEYTDVFDEWEVRKWLGSECADVNPPARPRRPRFTWPGFRPRRHVGADGAHVSTYMEEHLRRREQMRLSKQLRRRRERDNVPPSSPIALDAGRAPVDATAAGDDTLLRSQQAGPRAEAARRPAQEQREWAREPDPLREGEPALAHERTREPSEPSLPPMPGAYNPRATLHDGDGSLADPRALAPLRSLALERIQMISAVLDEERSQTAGRSCSRSRSRSRSPGRSAEEDEWECI